MKNILVPTDFSDCAFQATKVACEIAKKTGANIYLLHIIDIPTSVGPSGTGVVQEDIPESIFLMKRADMNFKKLLQDKIFEKVPRVIEAVDFASTYEKIIERATQHEVDLIVMGSHGASGLTEFFVGSNTEKVARLAKCPVLTVKGEATANFDRIIFVTDFSYHFDEAYNKVMEFATTFGSDVELLRVNTPNDFETTSKTEEKVAEFRKRTGVKNFKYTIYNDYSVEDGISNYGKEVNASILALSSQNQNWMMDLFKTNTASILINHSNKLIFTYRAI